MVPLTEYEDYADILLSKRPDMLPGNPIIWIQTTWEGGKHPIKVAPYTRSMLDTYRNNVVACLILSTSTQKGKFDVASSDKFLYGLAPLPYATGLFPLALGEDIDIEFLPAVKDAVNMSFSERNKVGFKLAMKKDLGFFFGLGSVAYAVSMSLSSMTSSGGGMHPADVLKCKPHMALRIANAKHKCRQEHRALLPKDLFHLKASWWQEPITNVTRTIWKDSGVFGPWSCLRERSRPLSVQRHGRETACTFSRIPVSMNLSRKRIC